MIDLEKPAWRLPTKKWFYNENIKYSYYFCCPIRNYHNKTLSEHL